jgi:hypothetical protein
MSLAICKITVLGLRSMEALRRRRRGKLIPRRRRRLGRGLWVIGLVGLAWCSCALAAVPTQGGEDNLWVGPRQCPASDANAFGVDQNFPSTRTLAPGGADRISLCRYFGSNQRPHGVGKLAGERTIRSGKAIHVLTREFSTLSVAKSNGCFFDDEARIFAVFSYRHQADVPVEVEVSGCLWASNPRLKKTFSASSQLRKRLLSMTGYRSEILP